MQYRGLSGEELKSVIGGVSAISYASSTSETLTDMSTAATAVSLQHILPVDLKNILKGKLFSLPIILTA